MCGTTLFMQAAQLSGTLACSQTTVLHIALPIPCLSGIQQCNHGAARETQRSMHACSTVHHLTGQPQAWRSACVLCGTAPAGTGRVQDGSLFARRHRHASQHCTHSQGWHAQPLCAALSSPPRRWHGIRVEQACSMALVGIHTAPAAGPRQLQRSPARRLCSQPRLQLRPLPS